MSYTDMKDRIIMLSYPCLIQKARVNGLMNTLLNPR